MDRRCSVVTSQCDYPEDCVYWTGIDEAYLGVLKTFFLLESAFEATRLWVRVPPLVTHFKGLPVQ
jgi:hypothetical protein